jgi:hypothetical protein
MEFISLSEVLVSIAKTIDIDPFLGPTTTHIGKISDDAANAYWHSKKVIFGNEKLSNYEKIQWCRKMSCAAIMLSNELIDNRDSLIYAEFNGNKRINVDADTTKKEVLELLDHATEWGNRTESNYCTHFRNSITQGDAALAMSVKEGVDDGLIKDGMQLRLFSVGFDRAELVKMLNANGIAHSKAVQVSPVTPAAAAPPIDTNVSIRTTTHKMETRTIPLDAEIQRAKSRALNADSVQSVWDELVKMAQKKEGCLISLGGKNEVQYGVGVDVGTFTKRNLSDRMKRAKRRV